jgi:MFS family permease
LGGLESESNVLVPQGRSETGRFEFPIGQQRIILQVAVVTFLIGSALCGLAQTILQLILFRGLQGLGGAD